MATIALHDVEPDLLEQLARRAKQLGTTVEREALRALREHLAESSSLLDETTPRPAPIPEPPDAPSRETLAEDPRFIRRHGLWVFTGALDASAIPDHRDVREERIDAFVKAALGEDGD